MRRQSFASRGPCCGYGENVKTSSSFSLWRGVGGLPARRGQLQVNLLEQDCVAIPGPRAQTPSSSPALVYRWPALLWPKCLQEIDRSGKFFINLIVKKSNPECWSLFHSICLGTKEKLYLHRMV